MTTDTLTMYNIGCIRMQCETRMSAVSEIYERWNEKEKQHWKQNQRKKQQLPSQPKLNRHYVMMYLWSNCNVAQYTTHRCLSACVYLRSTVAILTEVIVLCCVVCASESIGFSWRIRHKNKQTFAFILMCIIKDSNEWFSQCRSCYLPLLAHNLYNACCFASLCFAVVIASLSVVLCWWDHTRLFIICYRAVLVSAISICG